MSRYFGLLLLFMAHHLSAQMEKTFIYEITLLDQFKHRALWTAREHRIQNQHLDYLDSLTQSGTLQMAGIIDQGLEAQTGLIILKTNDYDEANSIALKDPSVAEGMMTVRLRPLNIYFKPKEEK